jgi:hypothetical protein
MTKRSFAFAALLAAGATLLTASTPSDPHARYTPSRVGTAPVSPFAQSVFSGVEAYYPLAGDVEDESGQGNDSLATGAVAYVPGIVGDGASFLNPGASITMPNMSTPTLTIAAWVKLNSLQPLSGMTLPDGHVIANFSTVVGPIVYDTRTGQLGLLNIIQGVYNEPYAGPNLTHGMLTPGTWHHVVVQQDLRPNAREGESFWLDGQFLNVWGPVGTQNQVPFMTAIGNTVTASGQDEVIDEVLVYNRMLNTGEIQYLASLGPASSERAAFRAAMRPTQRTVAAVGHCGVVDDLPCSQCSVSAYFSFILDGTFGCGYTDDITPTCSSNYEVVNGYCSCPANTAPIRGSCFSHATISGGRQVVAMDNESMLINWAKIQDADLATYRVPDPRGQAVDCARLRRYISTVCQTAGAPCDRITSYGAACRTLGSTARPTCSTFALANPVSSAPASLPFPMRTLEEWHNYYQTTVSVNANWFYVGALDEYPHKVPCTAPAGFVVSDSTVLSPASTRDKGTTYMDAFVVQRSSTSPGIYAQQLSIVQCNTSTQCSNISQMPNVIEAVGGFQLVKNGTILTTPDANTPTFPGARTLLGINGSTLYVVQASYNEDLYAGLGPLARSIAQYMINTYGVTDVINLDNSGSSQFLYYPGGRNLPIKSIPGDMLTGQGDTRFYRPFPVVLGINE